MNEQRRMITTAYYIGEDNKEWVTKKAERERRSASWYLDDLLTQLREEENEAE
jgi:hypothetical protein